MQNQDDLTSFLFANVGAPFIIGLAVGYFAKKAIKMALFFGGLGIVVLFVSEYYGFAEISDAGLKTVTHAITEHAREFGGFLVDRLSQITGKGLSAVAGFYAGFKLG